MASFYWVRDRITGKYVKKENNAPIKKDVFNKTFATRKHATSEKKKSIYVGVSYVTAQLKWRAYIMIDGVMKSLGHYSDEREAALAYDHQAIKIGRKTNILKSLEA